MYHYMYCDSLYVSRCVPHLSLFFIMYVSYCVPLCIILLYCFVFMCVIVSTCHLDTNKLSKVPLPLKNCRIYLLIPIYLQSLVVPFYFSLPLSLGPVSVSLCLYLRVSLYVFYSMCYCLGTCEVVV